MVLFYNGLLATAVLIALTLNARQPPSRRSLVLVAGAVALGLGSVVLAALMPFNMFGKIQLLTWAAFLHAPLFLLGSAGLCARHARGSGALAGALALALLVIATDAFLIEPRWLEVTTVELRSAKISAPVRIAFLADIQTDAPGAYEARVFREVTAARPDLILFGGDYIQQHDHAAYQAAAATLQQQLREAGWQPRLGAYAVQGNVDAATWPTIFAGTGITPISEDTTFDLGEVTVTALSRWTSGLTQHRLVAPESAERYHIVVGHLPNYSLGEVAADLLLAGHVHGGQVRLPFIGPLITLAATPRAWAVGVTALTPEQTLIVSRGIGMERGTAPRLRFLCRPELILIDLLPLNP